MTRLRVLLEQALDRTKALWPDLERAFAWVRQAAAILENPGHRSGAAVRQALRAHPRTVRAPKPAGAFLRQAYEHFAKITASYEPGLFHCYNVEGLDRTNNALEQFFGSWRWHERRATGRKCASRTEVLRGPVSLASSVATRLRIFTHQQLAAVDRERWRQKRAELRQRRDHFCLRCQFRRDPKGYLNNWKKQALKLTLLS